MKDVAAFFKVLSDPARVQILWLLFNNPELCVCDIMGTLRITQSKASRHLATLRHAGLVTDRRDGAWSYYSLRQPGDVLEAEVIGILKSRLALLPDAGSLLVALGHWLDVKAGRQSCCSLSGGGDE